MSEISELLAQTVRPNVEAEVLRKLKFLAPILKCSFAEAIDAVCSKKQIARAFAEMELETCLCYLKSKNLCAEDGEFLIQLTF